MNKDSAFWNNILIRMWILPAIGHDDLLVPKSSELHLYDRPYYLLPSRWFQYISYDSSAPFSNPQTFVLRRLSIMKAIPHLSPSLLRIPWKSPFSPSYRHLARGALRPRSNTGQHDVVELHGPSVTWRKVSAQLPAPRTSFHSFTGSGALIRERA